MDRVVGAVGLGGLYGLCGVDSEWRGMDLLYGVELLALPP